MRSSARPLVWATLLLALSAPAVVAQRVDVEHLANLGDTTGGPNFVGQLLSLAVLPNGLIAYTDVSNATVRVHGPAGAFRAQLGRSGEGPGEYNFPPVLLPGDSGTIEMFDLGRRIVYSDSLTHLRTTIFPPGPSFQFERVGDSYVIPKRLNTASGAGLPLHVYSRDGEYIRSLGAEPPIRDVRNKLRFARRVTASSDSTFWSGDLLRYRLQHWTLSGRLLHEVTREPRWFPPQEDVGIDREDGPRPSLWAISYDSIQGVLWTATIVAKTDWDDSEVRGDYDPTGQPGIDSARELESVYKTVIEAIDPESGAVLAAEEIDAYVYGITGGNLAYAEGRTPRREPVVRIWTLRLIR